MLPVGYVTDAEGRRVFGLVPVAQLGAAGAGEWTPLAQPTKGEQAALDLLCRCPGACLELGGQVNPIRTARVAAGLTQAELASAMRITQGMLSRQEKPFRSVRPATIQRVKDTIRRIDESRRRPVISLDQMLAAYGPLMGVSIARKPRDPVERRLLREAGDPVALREDDAFVREGGERRRPPVIKVKE